MKKLHFFVNLLIILITTACQLNKSNSTTEKESKPIRIVRIIEDGHYDIIEIYGCKYVSNDMYGGITHLQTCTNTHTIK